jgi:hypothetical protein
MAPVKQDGTGKRVRWDLQLGQHMGEKGTRIPPKVSCPYLSPMPLFMRLAVQFDISLSPRTVECASVCGCIVITTCLLWPLPMDV